MVISFFYPALGGAEQQALKLAERLIEKGIPVSVLTRRVPGIPSFEIINTVPVYRYIRTLSWGKFFGITYFLSCLWQLFCMRSTYNIIHCHILQGLHSFAAMCFKGLFGKKVLIKVAMAGEISDFAVTKKMLFGKAMLRQLRKIDALIAICSQVSSEAEQEGFPPERIQRIPNGVDVDWYKPEREIQKIPNKIIFVGSLHDRKHVSLLISAVKKLKDTGVLVSLDIIGDGPEAKQLRSMACELDIMHQINFLGACYDIRRYLQRAQFFVLPSKFEGLPNVVLEAMACGLPVLATRVGGVPDIIEHRVNGLMSPSGDFAALCANIQELLNNQKLLHELGVRARQTAVDKFSLSIVADQYEALYRDFLAG